MNNNEKMIITDDLVGHLTMAVEHYNKTHKYSFAESDISDGYIEISITEYDNDNYGIYDCYSVDEINRILDGSWNECLEN